MRSIRFTLLATAFSLILAPSVHAQTTVNINVNVNAETVLQKVNPNMFGINTAIWDHNLDEPYTIRRLKQMGIGILRFPGGSAADVYNWKAGHDGESTTLTHPDFDDFATVAKGAGAQAMITVNYGTGTAAEAAAWVHYSNDVKHYGFKYWEIGNECYGTWEADTRTVKHDPYTYATEAAKYITEMKAQDPSIKVGIVVQTGEDSNVNNKDHAVTNPVTGVSHYGWTPVVLATMKTLNVMPDFLIYHRYEQAPHRESDARLLQMAKTWKDDAANLEMMKKDYLGNEGDNIQIVCTENNSVYGNPGKQTTSLVNALYLADSEGNILKTPFRTFLWWDLRNGVDPKNNNSTSLYGWRQYGDYGVLQADREVYPTFYAFEMLTHFARGGDEMVAADSSNDMLGAFACKQKSGDLALLLINKDPSSTENAQINITGYEPAGISRLYSYGIPQDDAAETGKGSQKIQHSSFSSAGSQFTISLAPYSITTLVLHPKRQ